MYLDEEVEMVLHNVFMLMLNKTIHKYLPWETDNSNALFFDNLFKNLFFKLLNFPQFLVPSPQKAGLSYPKIHKEKWDCNIQQEEKTSQGEHLKRKPSSINEQKCDVKE